MAFPISSPCPCGRLRPLRQPQILPVISLVLPPGPGPGPEPESQRHGLGSRHWHQRFPVGPWKAEGKESEVGQIIKKKTNHTIGQLCNSVSQFYLLTLMFLWCDHHTKIRLWMQCFFFFFYSAFLRTSLFPFLSQVGVSFHAKCYQDCFLTKWVRQTCRLFLVNTASLWSFGGKTYLYNIYLYLAWFCQFLQRLWKLTIERCLLPIGWALFDS